MSDALDEIKAHVAQARAHYIAIDQKLDAIVNRAARSRWTALLFGAWTLFAFWLGTKF